MTDAEIISKIAFLECERKAGPCPNCILKVTKRFDKHKYVNPLLVKTLADIIAEIRGDDSKYRTPLELSAALEILIRVLPHVKTV